MTYIVGAPPDTHRGVSDPHFVQSFTITTVVPAEPEPEISSVVTSDQPGSSKLNVTAMRRKLSRWMSSGRAKVGGKLRKMWMAIPTSLQNARWPLALLIGIYLAWLGLDKIVLTPDELQRAQLIATCAFVLVTFWLVFITRLTLREAQEANRLQSVAFRVLSIYPHVNPTLQKLKSELGLNQRLTVYNRTKTQISNLDITVFRYTQSWSRNPDTKELEPLDEYEVIYSDFTASLHPGYRFRCSYREPEDCYYMKVLIQLSDIFGHNHIELYTFQRLRPTQEPGMIRMTYVEKRPEEDHPLIRKYDQTGSKKGVKYVGDEDRPSYVVAEMLTAIEEYKGSLYGLKAIDRSNSKIDQ